MNLIAAIRKEHSRAQCERIVRYIGEDKSRFAALVRIFLAGPYRLTQRAAWPLSYCVERHPHLVQPYLGGIIRNLSRNDIHDAVKRNTLRLLQFISMPLRWQGPLSKICFEFLSDPREPIAVRVFSMTVLGNISQKQPDLKNELRMLIEEQLPYASAGFRARARKVLESIQVN